MGVKFERFAGLWVGSVLMFVGGISVLLCDVRYIRGGM